MTLEVSLLDLRKAVTSNNVKGFLDKLEREEKFFFRVYALPWREFKIRAVGKRLIKVEEGKLRRLEYSLMKLYVLKGSITFKDFAIMVGDYKAAVGYLLNLADEGIISFNDRDTILYLYMAHAPLSQKRYERNVARILDKKFTLNEELIARLSYDDLPCVYDAELRGVLCRYLTSNTRREQAKAQVRAFNDALSELSEEKTK